MKLAINVENERISKTKALDKKDYIEPENDKEEINKLVSPISKQYSEEIIDKIDKRVLDKNPSKKFNLPKTNNNSSFEQLLEN